jgi:flagellar hook-length control protein FliK
MKVGSAADKNRKQAAAAAAGIAASGSGSGSQGAGSEAGAAHEFSELLGELQMRNPSLRTTSAQDGALFDSLALSAAAPRVSTQEDLLRRDQAHESAEPKQAVQSSTQSGYAEAEADDSSSQPGEEYSEVNESEQKDALQSPQTEKGEAPEVQEIKPAQPEMNEVIAQASAQIVVPTGPESPQVTLGSEQALPESSLVAVSTNEQHLDSADVSPLSQALAGVQKEVVAETAAPKSTEHKAPQVAQVPGAEQETGPSLEQQAQNRNPESDAASTDVLKRIQDALLDKLNPAPKGVEKAAPVTAQASTVLSTELSAGLVRSLTEGASAKAALQRISAEKPQAASPLELAGAQRPAASTARTEDSKARPVRTRALALQAMEKIESALKEAARSRDGKTISVRLDPPNMGSIKVDVSLRDGVLHARIVPEVAQVTTMLRERAHELQGLLRKLGLSADTVSVSIGGEKIGEQGKEDFFASNNGRQNSQEQRAPWQGRQGNAASQSEAAPSALQQSALQKLHDHWVA